MVNKRPNIQDIAAHAQVARATVSRVLNNDPHVSAKSRERVLQAIEALNYRPSFSAKYMRTKRSHTIGFITDHIATTPFAGDILKGAQDAAWAHGVVLLVVNTGRKPEVETAAIEIMLERDVEGIIYAAMYHREVALPANMRNVPCVLLDCFSRDRSVSSVVPDEVGGAYTAIEVFLKKGHRRIAFINIDPSIATIASEKRLQGYRQALAAYNVALDETLVSYGNAQADSGYTHTMTLMQSPELPSAIFCGNDRMAMGCYMAVQEMGLKIPRDVAVIGFDNQRIIARYLRPPLSTMSLPHYEMGQWAIEQLRREIAAETNHTTPVQHQLACQFVERESV